MFKVDILKNCKVCGSPIDKNSNKRLRSYCSAECRIKWGNKRSYWHGGRREKQKQMYIDNAKKQTPNKKKCGICGRWYKRVGHHIRMTHKMKAREYKEHMGLPVSRGIMTEDGRSAARDRALENGMDEQLRKVGVNTRFVKGDPRAKESHPLAGKKFEGGDYF